MTEDARALELYQFAQLLADAKGRLSVGLLTYKEYRQEALSIRYFPSTGHLEVWHGRKVFSAASMAIKNRQGLKERGSALTTRRMSLAS